MRFKSGFICVVIGDNFHSFLLAEMEKSVLHNEINYLHTISPNNKSKNFKLRRKKKSCTLSVRPESYQIFVTRFCLSDAVFKDLRYRITHVWLVETWSLDAYKLLHPLSLFFQTCATHAGHLRSWKHHIHNHTMLQYSTLLSRCIE